MKLNRLKVKCNSNFYIFVRYEKYDVKYFVNVVFIIFLLEVKNIIFKIGKII